MRNLVLQLVNQKRTWELLPKCPFCSHKMSYQTFNRQLKTLYEMSVYDEIPDFEIPKFSTIHCNQMIFAELQMHKIGDEFFPIYQDRIDWYVDEDGTTYDVNQHEAEIHYLWGNWKGHGIGYKRVSD